MANYRTRLKKLSLKELDKETDRLSHLSDMESINGIGYSSTSAHIKYLYAMDLMKKLEKKEMLNLKEVQVLETIKYCMKRNESNVIYSGILKHEMPLFPADIFSTLAGLLRRGRINIEKDRSGVSLITLTS